MTSQNVARRSVAEDLSTILESPEICDLIDRLQATRWTGRPGYPLRSMIGMALAKSLYALPTWTRTVGLVREHTALAVVIAPDGAVPSIDACYRFTAKLREHGPLLDACIASVVRALKKANPLLGWDVAIDASDMPAYANGQRYLSKGGPEREKYSDPDATWGHRSAVSTRKGGGFYGYRLHMAVCSKTDLPLAWTVETAKHNEVPTVAPLLDKLKTHGINPETCAMDKGYDTSTVHDACMDREVAASDRAAQDTGRQARRAQAADAASTASGASPEPTTNAARQVALPDRRVQARVGLDQGRPAAPADPARDAALEGPLPRAWRVERAFGRLKNEWASRRCECAGSSVCGFTPTSRSSRRLCTQFNEMRLQMQGFLQFCSILMWIADKGKEQSWQRKRAGRLVRYGASAKACSTWRPRKPSG